MSPSPQAEELARSLDPTAAKPLDPTAAKPLRADARRNRDRLIAVAAHLFEQRGTEVPLEDIARDAEVGIGTLYRHFPTRDALVEAVYRNEVAALTDGVDALLDDSEADAALQAWMRSFTRYVARKRGMATALKSMLGSDNALFAESHQRIVGALERLLDAASGSGAIRSDVNAKELLRAMGGICMAGDIPGQPECTSRLVDLLMDGLRFGAPGTQAATYPATV